MENMMMSKFAPNCEKGKTNDIYTHQQMRQGGHFCCAALHPFLCCLLYVLCRNPLSVQSTKQGSHVQTTHFSFILFPAQFTKQVTVVVCTQNSDNKPLLIQHFFPAKANCHQHHSDFQELLSSTLSVSIMLPLMLIFNMSLE